MTLADILPGARQLTPAEKLKLIRILIDELDDRTESLGDVELGFSATRFQESWQQAITGQTLPLNQLWED